MKLGIGGWRHILSVLTACRHTFPWLRVELKGFLWILSILDLDFLNLVFDSARLRKLKLKNWEIHWVFVADFSVNPSFWKKIELVTLKIAVGSAVCIFYWLIRNISNTRCSLSLECLSNFSQISQFQFLAVKKRQLKAENERFPWSLVDILNWAEKWVLLVFLVRQ